MPPISPTMLTARRERRVAARQPQTLESERAAHAQFKRDHPVGPRPVLSLFMSGCSMAMRKRERARTH